MSYEARHKAEVGHDDFVAEAKGYLSELNAGKAVPLVSVGLLICQLYGLGVSEQAACEYLDERKDEFPDGVMFRGD